jgi:hypothetical protein
MPFAFLAFAFVMRNAAGSCSPFEIIAANLSKSGWIWDCVSAVGSRDLGVESVVLTQDQPKSRSLIIHQ